MNYFTYLLGVVIIVVCRIFAILIRQLGWSKPYSSLEVINAKWKLKRMVYLSKFTIYDLNKQLGELHEQERVILAEKKEHVDRLKQASATLKRDNPYLANETIAKMIIRECPKMVSDYNFVNTKLQNKRAHIQYVSKYVTVIRNKILSCDHLITSATLSSNISSIIDSSMFTKGSDVLFEDVQDRLLEARSELDDLEQQTEEQDVNSLFETFEIDPQMNSNDLEAVLFDEPEDTNRHHRQTAAAPSFSASTASVEERHNNVNLLSIVKN